MTNDNRVPAGVPTGGEFATGQKAENDDLVVEPAFDQALADKLIVMGEDKPGWYGGQDEGFANWVASKYADPDRPGELGRSNLTPEATLQALNAVYKAEQLGRYTEHAIGTYDRLSGGRPGAEAFAEWVGESAAEQRLPSNPDEADLDNEFYTYRDDSVAFGDTEW